MAKKSKFGVKHHTNQQIDHRYTVNLEWCGQPERQYVARFCREWIGQSTDLQEAWKLAQAHYNLKHPLPTPAETKNG